MVSMKISGYMPNHAATMRMNMLLPWGRSFRKGFPLGGSFPPGFAVRPPVVRHHWMNLLGTDVLSLERTRVCFETIDRDPMLGYDLPQKCSTLPGQILKQPSYNAIKDS